MIRTQFFAQTTPMIVSIMGAITASLMILPAASAQEEKEIAIQRGARQDVAIERQEFRGLVPTAEGDNILLITLDNLRPDALSSFGAKKADATPNIDQLAKESFRFPNAFAVTDHRLAGILALVYGQYPSTFTSIGDISSFSSIAAHLADRGFYVGGSFPQKILEADGLRIGKLSPENDLGFSKTLGRGTSPDSYTGYVERLFSNRRDAQIFGWIHIPYLRPPALYHPGFNFGTTLPDHYAAAMRCADEIIGRSLQSLKAAGLAQSTIVIIAGTTGLDFDLESGQATEPLSDESLRVPLIVHIPGIPGKTIDENVETIDILPSILTMLDKSIGTTIQGRSFVSSMIAKKEDKKARRFAYAEHTPLDREIESDGRQSVTDGKHRLIVNTKTREAKLYEAQKKVGDAEDVTAKQKAIAQKLAAAAEEMAVYTTVCSDLWRRTDDRAPEMSGAERDLARARWLLDRGDPRATKAITGLLGTKGIDPLAALELACLADAKVDAKVVLPNLDSEDVQVRALAGAYLAGHGDAKKGLDYAVQGLRPETPPARLAMIFEALGRSGAKEALEAINRFKTTTEDGAVLAARELARARLGDKAADARLVEFIVEPNAPFSKKPLIERLLTQKPPEAERILRLCLTDGDNSSETVGLVLDGLESLDGRASDRAVAGLLGHPDRAVRKKAEALLVKWGSLALYGPSVLVAKSDESSIDATARTLMATPGLVGSPLLPGVRFAAWVRESNVSKPKITDGLPVLDQNGVVFRVANGHTDFRYCVLTLKRGEGPALDSAALKVLVNDRAVFPLRVEEHDGLSTWIGRLAPGSLEPGQNQFHARLQKINGEVLPAVAVNFMLLPSGDVTPLAIAATETVGALPSTTPKLEAGATFPRQKLEYHLFYQVWGKADGEGLRLRLAAGERVFADIALPKGDASGDRVIDVGAGQWRIEGAKLEIIGAEGALRAQSVNALLFGVDRQK